jgi:peptide/nickel transport system substrate-binding protein
VRLSFNPFTMSGVLRSQPAVAIAMGLLLVVMASGCKPALTPPATGALRPIVHVSPPGPQEAKRWQYTTTTLATATLATDTLVTPTPANPSADNTEYRISPYPVGQFGGALTVAQMGEGPKTFNVWASYDAASSTMGGMLTSGLLETDPYTGGLMPGLAKSWRVAPDNRTYTVTLRKGLRWSDGHPLTSHDVVFTWNTLIAKGLGNPSNRDVMTIKGKFPVIKALDALTIQFITPEPFAPFLRQLGQGIAPAHVFEPLLKQHGDAAFGSMWDVQTAVHHPEQLVSCGLWVLHHYEPGEKAIYRPNPHYWTLNTQHQRLPYLKQYVIKMVKDLNGMALQFEQGNLDTYGVSGKDLAHIRQLSFPHFTLYNLGPSPSTSFVAFNLSQRVVDGKPLVDPVVAGWFQQALFRQAIDWAIDRQVLVRNILKGVGEPLFTSESKASPFMDATLAKGHPRDLAKARQLLQQAGFSWRQSDGQLLDAHANPVRFTLLTNTGNDERESAGVSIKQDLADLGIIVDFKPMEFNVLVGKLQGTQPWETILLGLSGGSSLEPNDGANVWRSNGGLHLFNQRNVKQLGDNLPTDRLPWEAEIDNLLYQGAVTLDVEQRKAIYHRMQGVIQTQQPMVYLYTPLQLSAVSTRLQNLYPTPLGGTFHNLESVWVK